MTAARADIMDAVVVGGGVMGSSTAIALAQGGMRVALIERHAVGTGASGVNAGTLSLQIKRAALVPYALRGLALWQSTKARFGVDIHYRQTGGITVAFTDAEAEMLQARMSERKAAGVPLEIVSANRARDLEPGLSAHVRLASHCPADGYANSAATGRAYRAGLVAAGVTLHEGEKVTAIAREGGNFDVVTPARVVTGRRLVLAGGAWLRSLGGMIGAEFPITVRTNIVSVTERLPTLIRNIVGHAYGVLTLKQSAYTGTMLIGGGWQGRGDPERGGYEVIHENLVGNLRLAQHAVEALREARIARTWLGLEAHAPDFMPLAGPIPGVADAYVLACVRGGYTIGPYMGELLAQRILGREPELPLFDPGRFATRAAA